jgi:hypothetical protein
LEFAPAAPPHVAEPETPKIVVEEQIFVAEGALLTVPL